MWHILQLIFGLSLVKLQLLKEMLCFHSEFSKCFIVGLTRHHYRNSLFFNQSFVIYRVLTKFRTIKTSVADFLLIDLFIIVPRSIYRTALSSMCKHNINPCFTFSSTFTIK